MKYLRVFLWPFALFYLLVTSIRNLCYDYGIFKQYPISGKSISIGNLSLGGTGKSPMTIYLANLLVNKGFQVATLSRGYGRKTKGLLEVTIDQDSAMCGDEPLQYKTRFGDRLIVVVCESRKVGVEYIRKTYGEQVIILLDDAFQHRKVKAGLSILISEYTYPFWKDAIFPVGRLREHSSGKKRAEILVLSKCPDKLEEGDRKNAIKLSGVTPSQVHFSSISYLPPRSFDLQLNDIPKRIALVCGIANPKPLLDKLTETHEVLPIFYPDHHPYSVKDLENIHKKIRIFAPEISCILTSEKDWMRLKNLINHQQTEFNWYFVPIDVQLLDSEPFEKRILDYASKN